MGGSLEIRNIFLHENRGEGGKTCYEKFQKIHP